MALARKSGRRRAGATRRISTPSRRVLECVRQRPVGSGCAHPTRPDGLTFIATRRSARGGTDRMATATAVKLKPLGDKVVVRPTQREETTKSGIVLPDTAKEKPQEGTIVA